LAQEKDIGLATRIKRSKKNWTSSHAK
jgi:hypothetical protein